MPIYSLVILLLLIYLVIIWNLSIGLVALKKPFRLVRNFIPCQNVSNLCFCPQLFQLLVFIPSKKFKVSCRFTMGRDGAYKILPAPDVSSNYTLLLRFTTGTLNVRHCFLLGGRLSFSGPCFLPFCKVRTPDSHELQSCVATSHMEMNT